MLLSHSSVNPQPHRSNQNIESSSVSFNILGIHLNCFLRSLVRSLISRGARPTVKSVNRQKTKYQSLEETESSLKDGSDESSFRCLRHFFFFLRFFIFALDPDEDVSDESDDEGSGSGFTSCLCVSLCFELYVDCVS